MNNLNVYIDDKFTINFIFIESVNVDSKLSII